jgi:hypothetical protein
MVSALQPTISEGGRSATSQLGTPLGELITITLEYALDTFIRTFTLMVPTIRVADEKKAGFDIFGVETLRDGLKGVQDHTRRIRSESNAYLKIGCSHTLSWPLEVGHVPRCLLW